MESSWDNRGVTIHSASNTYKLLTAIATEHERVRTTYNKLKALNKVGTAEGHALDKFGFAVNLPRQAGESDDSYRKRIILRYRINSIEGTMEEIMQFMATLLDTTTENVEYNTRFTVTPATLFVSTEASLYENSALTFEEIENIANEVVSAGHRIVLEERGTFRLTNDELLSNEGHIAEKGLTADDIETGGTLAADLL